MSNLLNTFRFESVLYKVWGFFCKRMSPTYHVSFPIHQNFNFSFYGLQRKLTGCMKFVSSLQKHKLDPFFIIPWTVITWSIIRGKKTKRVHEPNWSRKFYFININPAPFALKKKKCAKKKEIKQELKYSICVAFFFFFAGYQTSMVSSGRNTRGTIRAITFSTPRQAAWARDPARRSARSGMTSCQDWKDRRVNIAFFYIIQKIHPFRWI